MIGPLGNAAYDRLKFLAQILLPALGTLYFALAGIWGLPSADEVVATILAVDTFLGVLLGLSSNAYDKTEAEYDGSIHLGEVEGDQRNFRLELPLDAGAVEDAKKITLKVRKPAPED